MKKLALFLVFGLLAGAVSASAADPDIETLYAVPNNPYAGTHFDIYVRAEDGDGIDRIKFYAAGRLEDVEDCDEEDECAVYFEVYEPTPGYHVYGVKAYDTEDDTESDEIEVYVRPYSYPYPYGHCGDGVCGGGETAYSCPQDCGPANYCGNGVCGPGETCFSCPQDCGPCARCGDGLCNGDETCSTCPTDCGPCDYCGDGRCSSTESCSTCPQDCGSCPVAEPVLYTCEQRGGTCCGYGGQGVVSGAADCPSSCFASCNPAPEPEPRPGSESPAGGAIVVSGTSLALLGAVVVLLLLAVFLAARR